jgi:hypothetical protein
MAVIFEALREGGLAAHELYSWFGSVEIACADGRSVTLRAPDALTRDRITARYRDQLSAAIQAVYPGAAVEVVVGGAS